MFDRLVQAGSQANREVAVKLSHQNFSRTLFVDLLVASGGVYELKVVRALNDAHRGQLLTYLCLLNLRRGKLVNFGATSVQSEYVDAPMSSSDRRDFNVVDDYFTGQRSFLDLIVTLLRDWGTCLTLSIYQDAVIYFLGGQSVVEKRLPLNRDQTFLGTQVFQMASKASAFRLTAFKDQPNDYPKQLQRLLTHCQLDAIHWINLQPRQVTFTTIYPA